MTGLMQTIAFCIELAFAEERRDIAVYIQGRMETFEIGGVKQTVVSCAGFGPNELALFKTPVGAISDRSPYVAIVGQESTRWALKIKPDLTVERTLE